MLTEETVAQVMRLLEQQKKQQEKTPIVVSDPNDPRNTIVLLMNEDGTIALDLENNPALVEDQLNDLINRGPSLIDSLSVPSVPVEDVFRILAEKLVSPTTSAGKTRLQGMNGVFASIYGQQRHILDEFSRLPNYSKRDKRNYGPCVGCGKPARNRHCFACQSTPKQPKTG